MGRRNLHESRMDENNIFCSSQPLLPTSHRLHFRFQPCATPLLLMGGSEGKGPQKSKHRHQKNKHSNNR